jgi:hypothetical protein
VPLTTSLTSLDVRASAVRFSREVSLASAVVLLVGLGSVGPLTTPTPLAAALTAVTPAGSVLTVGRELERAVVPHVVQVVKAKKKVAAHPVAAVAPGDRWLPTGTGMWVHQWSKTEHGNGRLVVRRAKLAGLSHLFVKTGSSHDGWVGAQVLGSLMPATKRTNIKVVAWDFPTLVHPEADARRLARAAWWHKPGVPMVAAVAPDIETASEGTHATRGSIERYYRTLRKSLPSRVAILATVPWPSENRVNRYPYVRTVRHADAIIPMAYWYNRSPTRVTRTSMRVLKAYGKPVIPVGQGYDGRLDAPYLAPDRHPGKSVDAFVTAARMSGARSVSLWSWQTTGAQQWSALKRASKRYAPAVRRVQAAAVRRPLATSKVNRPDWHRGWSLLPR